MKLLGCYFTTFFLAISISAQTLVDGHVVSHQSTGTHNATNDYIRLYQNYISELKGARCAMYPSCSNYGLQIYSEKNFFEACTLISDRLIRCGQDQKFYDKTYEYGYRSLFDTPYYGEYKIKKSLPRVEILKSTKDSTILFINHLINEREYSSALLEIERIHYTNGRFTPTLFLKRLQCLRGLGRNEDVLYEYHINTSTNIKESPDILFEVALNNYLLGNSPVAIEHMQTINDKSPLFLKSGILRALSSANDKDYQNSKNIFSELSGTYPENTSLKKSIYLIENLSKKKEKSPAVARILSIIPGAGYLYAGHKGSAATSLLINSLLMYATYTSIKSDNYGVAGIMGFFSLSFYIGNINGAARSAKRYNEKTKNDIISEIERINNIFNF